MTKRDKWLLLFLATIFTQILVISTGGLDSPFLILFHMAMIGISFIFSFSVSLVFLLFSIGVLLVNISFSQNLVNLFLANPTTMTLKFISFLPIASIAYIISQNYHAKDVLFKNLNTKVLTDETILANIDEFIFVTDSKLNILSVNDAVERILKRPKSTFINTPLFQSLLLRDGKRNVADKETFFPHDSTAPVNTNDLFKFVRTSFDVKIHIEQVKSPENEESQISFILTPVNHVANLNNKTLVEKARARYNAIGEDIKNILTQRNLTDVKTKFLLLERIENDIYTLQKLEEYKNRDYTSIDIAQLCKGIVALEQDYAKLFGVNLDLQLKNFGYKDIKPLTVASYPVNPKDLTGPFFTVKCNVRYAEKIIRKLVDLSILLSEGKNVTSEVNIERREIELLIQVSAPCGRIEKNERDDIFKPYYGSLYNKTHLSAGSGLEGFLVKSISDNLSTPLEVKYTDNPSPSITFLLRFSKNPQTSAETH